MTERIEGLSIGLDLETLKVERGLTGLKDRLRTVNSEMKANLAAFDRGEQSIGKYETTLKGLNKKLEVQKLIVSESRAEYEKMVEDYGEGSKEAEAAARAYNNQVAALKNLERNISRTTISLEDLEQETKKSGFSLTGLGDRLKDAAKNASGLAMNATKIGSAVGSFAPVLGTAAAGALGLSSSFAAAGAGAVAFGAVATSVLGNVFDSTEELEKAQEKLDQATNPEERKKALAEIDKIYAGMSKGQREAVKDLQEFKGFWGDFTKQFEEPIFEGFGKSLDIGRNVLNKLAPTIKNVADVTNELIDSLGNAVNGSEATKFFDWLATNAGEALRSFGQIAGNAIGGVLNLLRAFTPVGVSMEMGLVNLSDKFKQWSATLENSQSFQSFIEFVKTNGLLVLGALGNLFGVLVNVGKLIAPVLGIVSNALFTIIGKLLEWLNNLRLSNEQVTSFKDGVVTAFQNLKTFVQPAIAAVSSFVGEKIKEIKAFWDADGQQFVQAIKNAFSMIQSIVSFVMPVVLAIIKSVWSNIQGVISGALNIIIGLAKVFTGIFTLDFSKMWEGLKQIFSGSIQFIWNFIQLNMFGKLLSLGKVFITSFRGVFVGLWNGLKSLFSSSVGFLNSAVVKGWNLLLSGTKTIFNTYRSFLSGIWSFLKSMISKTASGIVSGVRGSWNLLKSVTTTIFNAYRSFLSGIWNFLKSMISKTASAIANAVRSAWNSLKSTTTSIFNSVRSFLTSLWTGVQKTVSNLASKTKDGVVNAWSTLRNRTTELFTSIKTKTSKIFEDIVSGAKKLPGRIGDGIRSMAGKVKDGVSAVGKKLAGGLESVMNTITQKGINVVLDKIGVSKKNQIPALNIPGYATGTDFHPGGWAILGDGGKQELLRTPDGRMALSPDTDTLMNLPRGTQVLSGEQTQEFMSMFPAYKKGTGVKDVAKTAGKWLKDTGSKALEKAGEAKGKVSDSIGDIWSYMSDPKKLMNKVFSSLNLKMPDVGGIMGQLAKASVTKVKDGAANFIKKMFGDFGASVAAPAGKGVARWRPVILKAAAVMKESVSDAEVNGILKQIQRESGGNEKIVQSSAVWDVNTAAGNPARGLLQYIPQTFNAYKVKGHNNIYSGYDQLLAFFNNTTWRRDLPYGRRGWGPRGRRKYKNGTGILGHIGGSAILGDGGKVEPFLMPNGLLGLSPDSATLYPNLPKGTIVWPSIQEFIKEYSQAAASTIATNENQRTDAMKLLALAGKELQRNKRSNQLSTSSGNTSSTDQGQQQVQSIHVENNITVAYSGLPNRDDVIKFAKWLQEIMDEQTEQQLRAKGVRWVVHGQSY
ncbi:hypothetical protein ABEW81_19390 [Priestia megaterium]